MVMWRFGAWPSFKAIDECEFAPRRTDVVVVLMREQGSLASQPLLTQTARKGLVNGVACGCPRGMRMTSFNLTSLTTNMRFATVVARLYIAYS